ncbi:MAG: thiazolylpeptide-type bacteriocin, partial [Nocardiopsis sp. BM-2018]
MAVQESPTIELPDLNFDDMEVMSVREAVAVPETGAT